MWHESWRSIKGQAATLATIEKMVGRRLTSDVVRAACKKLGISGIYKHGRYEYTPTEIESLIQYLGRRP